jgi:hypothetical protein
MLETKLSWSASWLHIVYWSKWYDMYLAFSINWSEIWNIVTWDWTPNSHETYPPHSEKKMMNNAKPEINWHVFLNLFKLHCVLHTSKKDVMCVVSCQPMWRCSWSYATCILTITATLYTKWLLISKSCELLQVSGVYFWYWKKKGLIEFWTVKHCGFFCRVMGGTLQSGIVPPLLEGTFQKIQSPNLKILN